MKEQTSVISGRQTMPDWAFVLWAGGTALLSYSLVYALRKPFTAAEFAGMQVCGMDYKTQSASFSCWATSAPSCWASNSSPN